MSDLADTTDAKRVARTELDAAQLEVRLLFESLGARLDASPRGEPRRAPWDRLFARANPLVAVRGLYLWGGVGRGKTLLMDRFFETLGRPDKRRLHFRRFMGEVHSAMAALPRRADPLDEVASRWRREVGVLCLDDLEVTDVADAAILHRLLRALLGRGLTLVATSNTHPRGLYPNGLQRQLFLPAIDLLERHTLVHEIGRGPDYRCAGPRTPGLPSDPGLGEALLAERFKRLAGTHAAVAETIQINGRSLAVRGVGPGVVWLDFDALCDSPRSAADYMDLANRFGTLLLSGVPRLVPAREAAARRFLHLIDVLYDRRVQLLFWSQAPLDRLYGGGIHRFPEERLLSRLTQMQSMSGSGWTGTRPGD